MPCKILRDWVLEFALAPFDLGPEPSEAFNSIFEVDKPHSFTFPACLFKIQRTQYHTQYLSEKGRCLNSQNGT